jgi:hypothetical protein
MDETELSERWREASRSYVTLVNAYVKRGLTNGWDKAGSEPQDRRRSMAADVLAAVRHANMNGDVAALRERFPPAWEPFTEVIAEKGQGLAPMAWIDDRRIALHVGATYENGSVVVVSEEGVIEHPDVLSFGRSPNGRFFALALEDQIQVRRGWEGPIVASFPWPTGQEGAPSGYQIEDKIDRSQITQLVAFPDGERVLLVCEAGIFVLTGEGATRLLPLHEEYHEAGEQLQREAGRRRVLGGEPKEQPVQLSLALAMEHGAVSPRGDLILAGCQDSTHLVFDADFKRIASVGPFSEYAHFAWFSADGAVAAFNACHFYNGASIGVQTEELRGLNTRRYDQHAKVRELQQGARVYAAVARGDEFIVGDAAGYLQAFDLAGTFRWQHFVGSTITALDLNPDGSKLAVTSYAGILCILELDAEEPDPFAIGTASHRELRRWLFWKGEEQPLKW